MLKKQKMCGTFIEWETREPMITYADLIQTGIFIVALVGLCYTIFKGKK